MKKNFCLLWCLMLLFVSCEPKHTIIWDGKVARSFSNGDGSKQTPYIISSTQELALFLTKATDANYKLTQDLDMGAGNEEGGLCCPQLSEFSGTLDGGKCVIRNIMLAYHIDSNTRTGLIGTMNGTITNLGICELTTDEVRKDGSTHQLASSGMVVTNNGTISNCLLMGLVYAFGGFAFENNGTIEYCLNNATQVGSDMARNGGIAATNNTKGVIRGCAFTGTKATNNRNNYVGTFGFGSIVSHNKALIDGCYSSCVHSINDVGSFVAGGKGYEIRGCYMADSGAKLLSLYSDLYGGAIVKGGYVCADNSPKQDNYDFDSKYVSESYMYSNEFVQVLNNASSVEWISDDGTFNIGKPMPKKLLPMFEWNEDYNMSYI